MGNTFKDLKVWEKAHETVLQIYAISKNFPSNEQYGLVQQVRRSASSVPTNIVEGYKRKSYKDFAHFLNLAETSLEETKYHLLLARDLSYLAEIDHERLSKMLDEVGRMLSAFQKTVRSFYRNS